MPHLIPLAVLLAALYLVWFVGRLLPRARLVPRLRRLHRISGYRYAEGTRNGGQAV